ncbi:YcfL family protein [Thalassotalea euphylliae]|uniref:YcfL family protein n=1 Tax=Thalassotalea euphylliae TaxID=1655234 RepID=UPI00362A79DA
MAHNFKKIGTGFLLAACLAACSSPPPITAGIGVSARLVDQQLLSESTFDNEELAELLAITSVKGKQTNGFLQGNVQLKNKDGYTQTLQYQFTWFDEQGYIVEAESQAWKPLELHGGQEKSLVGIAPSPQAKSFKFYVREAHKRAYEFDGN